MHPSAMGIQNKNMPLEAGRGKRVSQSRGEVSGVGPGRMRPICKREGRVQSI